MQAVHMQAISLYGQFSRTVDTGVIFDPKLDLVVVFFKLKACIVNILNISDLKFGTLISATYACRGQ